MKIFNLTFLFFISTLSFGQAKAALKVSVTDFGAKALKGEQVLFVDQSSKTTYKGVSDAKGEFIVDLPAGKYDIKIKSIGDAEDFSTFEVPPLPPGQSYKQAGMQIQIAQPKFFTLDNLNFNTGKWDILKSSHDELNELLEYLELKPDLKIEIGGHTDSDGADDSNLELSQKRAESVKKYLVSKGIDDARIKAKGYGESSPIADNSTDKGKAQNRRTEVKILN